MTNKKIKSSIIKIVILVILLTQVVITAFAASGYIIGGKRYLSDDISANPSELALLNNAINTYGMGNLIVDLDSLGITNYGDFTSYVNSKGLTVTNALFHLYAVQHPATVPAGTVIYHPNGTTTPDPMAGVAPNYVLCGYNVSTGVKGKTYFVDPTATPYASSIGTAVSLWNNATSKVSFTTGIIQNSTIDLYAQDSSHDPNFYDCYAWTEYYVGGSIVFSTSSNWNWNKIKINTALFNPASSAKKSGVLAHEMGHCFGLDHNPYNLYTLMNPYIDISNIYTPQSGDILGVNSLY